jgi:uncharacterized protein
MSETLDLYRLQQLDTRLSQIARRQKAIQDVLDNNDRLNQVRELLELTKIQKEKTAHELRSIEAEAARKKIKIQQTESSLYGGSIKNPKELQEVQQELALLKKQLVSLEDKQLELMLAVETTQAAFDTATQDYGLILREVEGNNSSLIGEREELQRETEKLTVERVATVESVSPKTLALYDQIREDRHGVAVTTVTDNSCDSCGALLTHAQIQSAHHSHQLYRCPSCGRIIYN